MKQDFPGMIGLRHALERDMRESDEQLSRTNSRSCFFCGKWIESKVLYDSCDQCKEKYENHPASNPGDGRV